MSDNGMVFYIKKIRVDYFAIMLYHNKVSGVSDRLHRQSDRNEEVLSKC